MLCKKCRGKFGPSYKYLINIVEDYKPGETGLKAMKDKFLYILKDPSPEVYDMQEKIKELEKRMEELEDKDERDE